MVDLNDPNGVGTQIAALRAEAQAKVDAIWLKYKADLAELRARHVGAAMALSFVQAAEDIENAAKKK